MQNGAHDGPLGCSHLPSTYHLRGGERHDGSPAYINLQAIVLNVDTAPDNFTRLAYAFQSATAERKVHWWLSFTGSSLISVDEMVRRSGPGDFKDPHELSFKFFAIANVV